MYLLLCLAQAYELLSDPERRKKYDAFGDIEEGVRLWDAHTLRHTHKTGFGFRVSGSGLWYLLQVDVDVFLP